MMKRIDEMLLALLRNGLWGVPLENVDRHLSELNDKEWGMVSDLALQQDVVELVYDGMLCLRKSLCPKQDSQERIRDYVTHNEQMHLKLNCAITELNSEFNVRNIPVTLFNGQVYAQMYDNPLRRHCGGIDLYVERKNYWKICKLVESWNVVVENADNNTMNFKWNAIGVTLHRDLVLNPLTFNSWKFRLWSEKMIPLKPSWFDPFGKDVHLSIATPSYRFNILFLFYHLYHQFLMGKVTLQVFCDWIRCLHSSAYIIKKAELKKYLNHFDLLHLWQMFGCIAVDMLKLPEKEFPFYDGKYSDKAEIMLNDILHHQSSNQTYILSLYNLLPLFRA
jgi:hypothetical protein